RTGAQGRRAGAGLQLTSSRSNSPFLAPSRNESHSSRVKRTMPASGALLLRTSITLDWRRASTQLPPLPVERLDIIQLTFSDIWGAPLERHVRTQLRRVNSTIAASDGIAHRNSLINALTPS